MLKGDIRISTITPGGQIYVGDVVRTNQFLIKLIQLIKLLRLLATSGIFQQDTPTPFKPKTPPPPQKAPNFYSYLIRALLVRTLRSR